MKITIPIDAIPQGRPRFYKGVAVDPPKCKQFKETFAWLLLREVGQYALPFTGAVKVDIKVYRQSSKFNSAIVHQYGDIDNLAKGILDACNGILWNDDSQIVQLFIFKFITDSKPYVEISVEELNAERGGRSNGTVQNQRI